MPTLTKPALALTATAAMVFGSGGMAAAARAAGTGPGQTPPPGVGQPGPGHRRAPGFDGDHTILAIVTTSGIAPTRASRQTIGLTL